MQGCSHGRAAQRAAAAAFAVEKIQAMFTVLGAFGSVTTGHSSSSTRFSMVLSLDFSATGRITAAHLQTMLLERGRVAQKPRGESSFNVFPLMLAGLDAAHRTMLHLHQAAESNSFGIEPFSKPEEKQRASAAFAQLRAAMGTLGITAEEQAAIWRILAGIYHLGAAGACKVGRKQFMTFERASDAAEVLGCDLEELTTAVFKHHLKQILAQVTARGSWLPPAEESPAGPKMTGAECVEGMASGLYEELFAAIVSLINSGGVATRGFHNPRHQRGERAATFEELCHNYVQERLQALFYEKTFVSEMERYREENVEVSFDLPERSPLATLSIVDLSSSQLPLSRERNAGRPFPRLCSYFATKGPELEGDGPMRRCEQALHFEISHQLGTDPVRYDLTGWVSKAKLNLSAENAIQVLQRSKVDAVKELVLPRWLACRAVAGLEGRSQAVLHRNGCVRKTFASSFAAVKKRSVCAQLKLQADALTNLLRRSHLHFVHCLLPGPQAEGPAQPPAPPDAALRCPGAGVTPGDVCLSPGYADRLLLTQFRRRFQVLAPDVMKKHTSAYEVPDESKAIEELFQALDLEKKSVAIGRSQVFLKPGVIARLEKQRDKLIAQKMILLQAACKGFLSRQKFKRLKIQRLAIRCIQKNLVVFQAVRHWPWWQLLSRVRPLLSVNLAEEQLRAKEEELAALRRKLEKSEQACGELRQTAEKLESKSKHDQVQKKLESVEKQLEEAQQLVQLREMKISGSGGEDEWQVRFDCAQTEIAFLRKRLVQLEQRLESELGARTGLEQKLGEAQAACEAAKKVSQQLRRRCRRLACELEDARVLAESQQSRGHELEKRQKKFDLQLAQALGESAFEKSLREKVSQENTSIRWEMGKLQQSLELHQRLELEIERMKQIHQKELEDKEEELEDVRQSCQRRVEEQLYQLQHERADLLKRIDEDQEDLNELMAKHKALIAQSATDIAQIRDLQTQVEDVKKEKQSLQEKLQAAQARAARLEQCPAERSIVSRQEARIRDLESQLDFQAVQMKRFEVLVLRLRDSIIKMGEELEKAAESEAREKESTRYYQRRMEEMKADMDELVQRELESSRRRVELEQQLAELAAVRQVLQADLGTSIRRIADLQVALEELRSSDESDAERDACSSVGSTLSLEPAESIKSWLGSSAGWSSPVSPSVAGSISVQSVGSRSTQGKRVSRDAKEPAASRPASSRSAARSVDAADPGRMASPTLGARRREYGKPRADEEELESPKKAADRIGETSPSVLRRGGSPALDRRFPSPLSPTVPRRRGLSPAADPVPSSSAALSEALGFGKRGGSFRRCSTSAGSLQSGTCYEHVRFSQSSVQPR
ncbi:PREDICTED: unconventional myosin-XVIIIb [Charadrius vociferus]|uniref:unconventional myosin-XVIIIb n=1 Tax=Charadrius vociferus TaxID=50402 RepID=UPI000521C2F3|nr:PREDICTED: unconventional myosin-XVIIIb [Charadrius vociferus]